MSDRPGKDQTKDEAKDAAAAAAARRRRAEVFGEVLPESTGDDRAQPGEESSSDEWLRRNVPPHHG